MKGWREAKLTYFSSAYLSPFNLLPIPSSLNCAQSRREEKLHIISLCPIVSCIRNSKLLLSPKINREMLPKTLQGHLSQLPQDIFLSVAKMSSFHGKSSSKLTVDTIGIKVKFTAVVPLIPSRTF